MPLNAYVLIHVSGPQTMSASRKIQKFKGVMSAHVVVGPYDVIAFVEGDNHKEIGDLVFTKIRRVQGVTAHYVFCNGSLNSPLHFIASFSFRNGFSSEGSSVTALKGFDSTISYKLK